MLFGLSISVTNHKSQLRSYRMTFLRLPRPTAMAPRLLRRTSQRPLYSTAAASKETKVKVQVKQVRRGDSYLGLRQLIEKAAFVAVDAEMTGVASAPWREAFEWDSAAVRFLKLRLSASHFALLQFGLCPFVPACHPSSGALSFVAHPHTFHLSPLGAHDGGDDDEFLCQTSSPLPRYPPPRLQHLSSPWYLPQFLFPFPCTPAFYLSFSLLIIPSPLLPSISGLSYLSRAQEKAAAPPALGTESALTSPIGFRHLIDLLSSHNKLIVGHNCLLGTFLSLLL